VLVRYVDDLVVMCRDRSQAEQALAMLRLILAELGLAPKETKTRIIGLCDGGEGFDFLGFEHRSGPGPWRPVARHRLSRALALTPGDAACPRAHS
jgi:hypothetical protein